MWSYRLVAPYTFERIDIPEKTPEALGDGQVLAAFPRRGSVRQRPPRLPRYAGQAARRHRYAAPRRWTAFPIHEIVGEVVASTHRSTASATASSGWASGFDGLMEYVVADGDGLAPYDQSLTPQHAVALQPLACVLYAIEQLPKLTGRHVAVIGQGSIGLLFSYVAKAAGARRVTGVDPIDRDAVGTGVRRRQRGPRDQ